MRTRQRVLAAISDAVADGIGPGDLTVAEVCRRAAIHRVTFYGHWTSIADAERDAFTEQVDHLAAVAEDAIAAAPDAAALARLYAAALDAQLIELAANRRLYRALLSGTRRGAFRGSLETALRRRAELAVAALVTAGVAIPPGSASAASVYLAGGLTAAFEDFVHRDEDDVERAAAAIEQQLPAWWPAAPLRGR